MNLMATAAFIPCALLVVLIVSIINALPYADSGSDLYRKDDVNSYIGMLQAENTCPVSGALEVCQSASLVKNKEKLHVHICPSDGN